jgi:hypothetical protein
MRSLFRGLAFLLAFLSTVALVAAQGTCPEIVGEALGVFDSACTDVGRNQICYGNGNIVALDFDGETLDAFAARGDISELSALSNLTLSGLDEELGLWGVAVLRVQADIPDSLPGQNVTILLFGETELETIEGDASSFVFSSGIGQTNCNEAPDGMLIQTPEGVGEIHITLNKIEIDLGSTAYITAEAEGLFTFALLEGHATLTIDDSQIEIEETHFTSIELDADLNPIGEFGEVLPIENHLELPELPLQVLPRDISEITATGEIIHPKQGNWSFTLNEIQADSCPAFIIDMMAQQLFINDDMVLDFGGDTWDFEDFLRTETAQNSGGELLEGTFTSPEPNVYLYNLSDGEVIFSFGMTLVSETYIQGFYYFDMGAAADGCKITIPYEVTFSE